MSWSLVTSSSIQSAFSPAMLTDYQQWLVDNPGKVGRLDEIIGMVVDEYRAALASNPENMLDEIVSLGNTISSNGGAGVFINGNQNNLAGNEIFGNSSGVDVSNGIHNTIFNKNLIYNNTNVESGIILVGDANDNIEAPVLKIFYNSESNDQSIVVGGLEGNSDFYEIEFFIDNGENVPEYLGSFSITPDENGNADIDNEWEGVENIVAGEDEVIATATDFLGNTSEF